MFKLVPPKNRPSTKATDFLALARVKAAAEPAGPLPIIIYSKSNFLPIFILFYHDFHKHKQNLCDIF